MLMSKKVIKNIEYCLAALIFLLVLVALIIYRSEVSKGIYKGISYSMSILIPSIMPFMFVSGLFSVLPCSKVLCKIMSPVIRYIFRLPECTASAVLFGLTCGYPVGAKLTSELLKNELISEDEAARLLVFTMNPGIPFCVLFLGSVILQNTSYGLVIYLCVTAGSVLLGAITGLTRGVPPKTNTTMKETNIFAALRMSADSTVRACLNMSFYIIVFWGFMALLHKSGVFQFLVKNLAIPFPSDLHRAGLFSFFFEVTGGISDSVALKLPLIIFVLGLSFGGVCIHFQLFSFFALPPIRYSKFLFFRLIHCALSGLCFRLIILAKPQAITTLSTTDSPIFHGMKGNFVGSVCLLLLFITYVLISQKETVVKKIKR